MNVLDRLWWNDLVDRITGAEERCHRFDMEQLRRHTDELIAMAQATAVAATEQRDEAREEAARLRARPVVIERLRVPFVTSHGVVHSPRTFGDGTHAFAIGPDRRLYKRVGRRPDDWAAQADHSVVPPAPTYVTHLYDAPPTEIETRTEHVVRALWPPERRTSRQETVRGPETTERAELAAPGPAHPMAVQRESDR